MKKNGKSCPSATLSEGAVLLGIVNENGSIGFISNETAITGDLYDDLAASPHPEKQFRFSSACVESGCRQWRQGKCSVIQRIIDANEEPEPQLPDCSIRTSCRWFYQEGPKACSFCPYVITNMLLQQ
jgi:hypothetical protein